MRGCWPSTVLAASGSRRCWLASCSTTSARTRRRREHPLLFSYLSFDRSELDPQFPLTLLGEGRGNSRCRLPSWSSRWRTCASRSTRYSGRRWRCAVRRPPSGAARSATSTGTCPMQRSSPTTSPRPSARPRATPCSCSTPSRWRNAGAAPSSASSARRCTGCTAGSPACVSSSRPGAGRGAHCPQHAARGTRRDLSEALLTKALRGRKVDPALIRLIVEQVSVPPQPPPRRRPRHPRGSRHAGTWAKAPALRPARRAGPGRALPADPRPRRQAVRPLANPGLVVRQITPDVIQSARRGHRPGAVSRRPRRSSSCSPRGRPRHRGRRGVLVHRADVRREMLPLLAAGRRQGARHPRAGNRILRGRSEPASTTRSSTSTTGSCSGSRARSSTPTGTTPPLRSSRTRGMSAARGPGLPRGPPRDGG